jgi:hypothetical protein
MATPPRLQIKRTLTPDSPPAALEEGELSVELGGPIRLWAGHPTDPAGKVLLVDSSAGGGGTVDAYTKAEADAKFVDAAGDTMTGDLTLLKNTPAINIAAPVVTDQISIYGTKAGSKRWGILLGDGSPETGGNTGSAFSLWRYDDNGNLITSLMTINRDNGQVFINSGLITLDGAATSGSSRINMVKGPSSDTADIRSEVAGVGVWLMQIGDASDDFVLHRYDAGGIGQYVYWIQKADGGLYYQNDLTHKPGGGEWIAASDARIKTVVDYYDTGLDAIKQLMPVRYTYNGNDAVKRSDDTPSPSLNAGVIGKEFIGLVAQDIEGPMPEMVTSVEGFIDGAPVNDLRMMDASALKFALVNAVKELALRVESLEEQLAATRK